MRLADLRGRRVAVLGAGADVAAAAEVVRAANPAELVLVEESADAMIGPDLAALPRVDLATAATADVLVRSPGFPRYRPELVAARDRGAQMTTPLDLWLGTTGPARTVIGITGTKGKSTVTTLIGVLAAEAGLRVGIAGNLGPAVFGAQWDRDAPLVALEVSSYQAADLHHVPDVAVLTYLAQDHLSWHGGLDAYVDDKLRLLRNESGTAARILVAEHGGRAHEALTARGLDAEVVTPPRAPRLLPPHRVQNAALAAVALAAVGGPAPTDDAVLRAAATSMPGRLDPCPGPGGLFCVDDALASNPSATAAALAWLRELDRPTVVILGGEDRGVDPSPLVEEAARWTRGRLRAITVPENGATLARRSGIEVLAEMADVAAATARAADASAPEGVVLFSPGAPTPPGTGNWQTRSTTFRAALRGA